MCSLPEGQAINAICCVEHPIGLVMFDSYESEKPYYGNSLVVTFTLDDNKLENVRIMEKEYGWGGHRGKCYTNYVTRQEKRPAMGFSVDTPCLFTFSDTSDKTGTLYYDLITDEYESK